MSYGSCHANLIEDFRMRHDTAKSVLDTGAEEEGNLPFSDFLAFYNTQKQIKNFFKL